MGDSPSMPYSSKPDVANQYFQSLTIEQQTPESAAAQAYGMQDNVRSQEQQFMDEERNFARIVGGENIDNSALAPTQIGPAGPPAANEDTGAIRDSFG